MAKICSVCGSYDTQTVLVSTYLTRMTPPQNPLDKTCLIERREGLLCRKCKKVVSPLVIRPEGYVIDHISLN